jgi:hypothetical protein
METAVWTMEQGWTHHTGVKKVLPPNQKEQWAMHSHPGNTKVTLKKTIVKIFFLFHLGNGMLIINVTQSTFSLIVEFNACQVLPCGDLTSQLQLQDTPFICVPSRDPQGSLVSVQSGWMWGGTLDIKDTLLPFYENPKGWADPSALERL